MNAVGKLQFDSFLLIQGYLKLHRAICFNIVRQRTLAQSDVEMKAQKDNRTLLQIIPRRPFFFASGGCAHAVAPLHQPPTCSQLAAGLPGNFRQKPTRIAEDCHNPRMDSKIMLRLHQEIVWSNHDSWSLQFKHLRLLPRFFSWIFFQSVSCFQFSLDSTRTQAFQHCPHGPSPLPLTAQSWQFHSQIHHKRFDWRVWRGFRSNLWPRLLWRSGPSGLPTALTLRTSSTVCCPCRHHLRQIDAVLQRAQNELSHKTKCLIIVRVHAVHSANSCLVYTTHKHWYTRHQCKRPTTKSVALQRLNTKPTTIGHHTSKWHLVHFHGCSMLPTHIPWSDCALRIQLACD